MVTRITTSQRQVQAAIAHLIEMSGVRFRVEGEPVSAREVFAECGLLPEIARVADSILESVGAQQVTAGIVPAEHSMFGDQVVLTSPIPVLGVTALVAAAEAMLLERSLGAEPVLTEVSLDAVFAYLKTERQEVCPWAARMPGM